MQLTFLQYNPRLGCRRGVCGGVCGERAGCACLWRVVVLGAVRRCCRDIVRQCCVRQCALVVSESQVRAIRGADHRATAASCTAFLSAKQTRQKPRPSLLTTSNDLSYECVLHFALTRACFLRLRAVFSFRVWVSCLVSCLVACLVSCLGFAFGFRVWLRGRRREGVGPLLTLIARELQFTRIA